MLKSKMVKTRRLSNLWLINCLLFLSPFLSFASSCAELERLDLQQCGHYDFIAYGRVDGDLDCAEQSFLFTPIEVFKGTTDEEAELFTSCNNQGLAVTKGEYWILYGEMNNSLEVKLSFCGHSRKQLPKEQRDYETEIRGTSFEEDLAFLKANFDTKQKDKNELKARKYEKVDPYLVPILLGAGLLFMVVGFFIMKRLK